jgi:hypothetical protein
MAIHRRRQARLLRIGNAMRSYSHGAWFLELGQLCRRLDEPRIRDLAEWAQAAAALPASADDDALADQPRQVRCVFGADRGAA